MVGDVQSQWISFRSALGASLHPPVSLKSAFRAFISRFNRPVNPSPSVQERLFGGNFDSLTAPSLSILTKSKVFNPAHLPPHRSNFSRDSTLRRSGHQNPALNSLFSASIRCEMRSSTFAGGRPGLRSNRARLRSPSSLLMKLSPDPTLVQPSLRPLSQIDSDFAWPTSQSTAPSPPH
jgi:hypothetical protein